MASNKQIRNRRSRRTDAVTNDWRGRSDVPKHIAAPPIGRNFEEMSTFEGTDPKLLDAPQEERVPSPRERGLNRGMRVGTGDRGWFGQRCDLS